jgi:plastocyanin
MRRVLPTLALALGAAVAAASPAGAADHAIGFAAYYYSPPDVTIRPGDTATFSGSFMNHPLVWDGGQFATTNSGTSQQFTFTQPGTYAFHCQFHEGLGMKGVIRVAPNQSPARVAFSVTPASPIVGQPVTFTYTGDPDPDGTLVRWEWDLDGDGSFETATPSPAATHVYGTAGQVAVRVRAVDNENGASAVAVQAVTVGAASGTPSSGTSSADRTAPIATRLRLRGLTLRFRSSERAAATATLRARGKTIARGSAKAGTTTLRLRLTAAGRAVLRRGHRLKATLSLTLRDPSGNARTVKRRVTVRRS